MSEKKETANGELKSEKSSEVSPDLVKDSATALSNGDPKLPEDPNGAKAALPDVIANRVANAC